MGFLLARLPADDGGGIRYSIVIIWGGARVIPGYRTVLYIGRCTGKHWVLICGDIRDSFTALRKLLTGIGYCRSEGHKYDIISPAGHRVLQVTGIKNPNI